MNKTFIKLTFAACLLASNFVSGTSQAQSLPPEQIKSILKLTKANWVAYRNYNGQQLVYFTHLESWKCGLTTVQYGLNDQPLNNNWPLAKCDEKQPNQVTKERPYLAFPLGHVKSIKLKLTFIDQTDSEIVEFKAP
ncbi:hypothetical protein [Cohaesibacter celericrescens]|uniref:hypothetical protein n=1 Tax=Cohaesibacter celericrescens TaxID=2067669 RepID=UPI001AED101E|nr:hypothetical protein [Cohaesibacter celericrescens]